MLLVKIFITYLFLNKLTYMTIILCLQIFKLLIIMTFKVHQINKCNIWIVIEKVILYKHELSSHHHIWLIPTVYDTFH